MPDPEEYFFEQAGGCMKMIIQGDTQSEQDNMVTEAKASYPEHAPCNGSW